MTAYLPQIIRETDISTAVRLRLMLLTSEFLMSALRVSGPRADALRVDAFMCIVHWDVYVALKRLPPTSDSQDSHYKGTRHGQRR